MVVITKQFHQQKMLENSGGMFRLDIQRSTQPKGMTRHKNAVDRKKATKWRIVECAILIEFHQMTSAD